MSPESSRFLSVNHPKIHRVDREIFFAPFVADCMTHACRCDDEGGTVKNDACCQHGADVDLFERDRILEKAALIAPILAEQFRDPARWFDDREPEAAPEFPSGTVIRTGVAGDHDASGCVFLQHDARGCAIHRAALEHDFDYVPIKPAVCQLYPLSFWEDNLGLSDDFARYSCGNVGQGDSVYRVLRPTLTQVFDRELVRSLDALEKTLLRARLPIVVAV